MRRTKILATIGPASETPKILTKMVESGLNAVRCNFSHGTADDHKNRVDMVRDVAKKLNTSVGILADLQGPKIRVAKFIDTKIHLEKDAEFILDAEMDASSGTSRSVGIDYKELPNDVLNGDILLLDDGKIILKVKRVEGSKIYTNVEVGGPLSNNKGINKKGGGLTAPALTDKDKQDIKTAASLAVDYVAVSFPRDGDDIRYARKLLEEQGCFAGLVAKIERTEAIENIEDIIRASDAVMVARGDLAVEIGEENVPAAQKMIINKTRELDKIAITATQMMESMISSPTPTRAEVSDVANAVLDGTDTVMLSAESAAGDYPVEAISAMDRVIRASEQSSLVQIVKKSNIDKEYARIDEALAVSAVYLANHVKAKALVSLTESGSTPRWMSRINTDLPIYALTRNIDTMGKMTLCRGVTPLIFDSTSMPLEDVNKLAVDKIITSGNAENGDWLILTSGDHMGVHGGTNKVQVLQVGKIT